MTEKLLKTHSFTFNQKDNGGESLSIITKIFHNGDPEGIFLTQDIDLQSYCNSATIHLAGAQITPTLLRELASQLEAEIIKAKILMEKDNES